MKNIRIVVIASLSLVWLVGMDCGAGPQDINLRYQVKDQGGSVLLLWDGAEDVVDFVVYADDSVVDTLPPDSLSYLFDSTAVHKTFKVVAEGARLDGSLNLSPYVDSFNIYEFDFSDTTPSGVSFDPSTGAYTLYNTKTDTTHWAQVQMVLADTVADSVDPASLRLVSPNVLGLRQTYTGFAPLTQNYAPTPDSTDSLFNYSYETFVTSSEYAAWLGADNYSWDKDDRFVRLTAVSVDSSGFVIVRYAFQPGDGLRWFPY